MRKTNFLILLIIFLLSIGLASAATCQIDQSATTVGTSNTYLRGSTVNISATISGDGNATVGNLSSSPGTITGTIDREYSDNQSFMNFTVDTTALDDSEQQTFTLSVKNSSGDEIATCSKTFYSDNTVPSVDSITPSDGTEDTDGDVTFTAIVYNSSSATLYFTDNNPRSASYSMSGVAGTYGKDTYTQSFTGLADGYYDWYVSATDGLNSTTSLENQVRVDDDSGDDNLRIRQSEEIEEEQEPTGTLAAITETKLAGMSIVVWFALALLIGGIYYYTRTQD